MMDKKIIAAALKELEFRELGTTQQILEIHELDYENGKPIMLRIDKKYKDNLAIVYFAIKDEYFHLAVRLEIHPKIEVFSVESEASHAVSLSISSDDYSFDELKSFTKSPPTRGWSKGDKSKSFDYIQPFSHLCFEPNPEPNALNNKLIKLFDFLDQDRAGILNLLAKTDAYITVISIFHNGNTMLGGFRLDANTAKRMSEYNLGISFDLYAEGNMYKEENYDDE